jgi:hypothetical protein
VCDDVEGVVSETVVRAAVFVNVDDIAVPDAMVVE